VSVSTVESPGILPENANQAAVLVAVAHVVVEEVGVQVSKDTSICMY
jgi:hypothetical protein